MKKILCIMSAFLLVSLAGCGDNSETVNMIYESEGITVKCTLEAKDDVVQKITQESTMDCSNFTEDQLSTIKAAMTAYEEQYTIIEGLEYSITENENIITEKVVIDATNEELLTQMSSYVLITVEEGETSLSLEETVKELEEQGLKVE